MPFVIPIAAAIATAAIAGAAAAGAISATLAIVLTIAVSIAATIATRAMQKKPKRNPIDFDDRTITIRQPIQPFEVWYGETRKGGLINFFENNGNDVWLVITWACHQVKALADLWLNDTQITVNIDGTVDGTYDGAAVEGKVFCYHHLGADDQVADPVLKAAFPLLWTDEHRGRGRAYSVLRFVNQPTNFPTGIPSLSVQGQGHAKIYDPRTGLYGYSDNAILCLRDHLTSTVYGRGVPFSDVDDDDLIPEANHCDESVGIGPDSQYFIVDKHYQITATNTTTDVCTAAGHRFATGEEIRGNVTGVPGVMPVPLVALTSYFAIRVSVNTFAFATSKANADADVRIDLTTTGTQPVDFWAVDQPLILQSDQARIETIDTANDTFTGVSDRIRAIRGSRVRLEFTSTAPNPLVEGKKYFIQFGSTGDALAEYPGGPIVNITSVGAHDRNCRVDGSGAEITAVDTATGRLTIEGSAANPVSENWPVGTRVQLKTVGGVVPAGAEADAFYYWIPDVFYSGITPQQGRLALTRAEAEDGVHIPLTSTGSGDLYLESDYYGIKACRGLLTGERIYAFQGFASVFPISQFYFYWIRETPTTGRCALTLEDAINGVYLKFDTDRPGNSLPVTTSFKTRGELTRLSQRRYTIAGIFDTGEDSDEVQRALATACGATVMEPVFSGQYKIRADRYRVPIHSLDETAIRAGAGINLQSQAEVREAANVVRGVYVTAENEDQPADIPEYADERAQRDEDNGERLVQDLQLPFTPSKPMALRLTKIALLRSRKQRTLPLPTFYNTMPGALPTDSIDFTFAPLAYRDRTFQIQKLDLSFDSADGVPAPRLDAILRETGPDIYRERIQEFIPG